METRFLTVDQTGLQLLSLVKYLANLVCGAKTFSKQECSETVEIEKAKIISIFSIKKTKVKVLFFSRRHRCKHNPGAATKSQILPLEDHQGRPIGEVLTGQEKVNKMYIAMMEDHQPHMKRIAVMTTELYQ